MRDWAVKGRGRRSVGLGPGADLEDLGATPRGGIC